MNILKREIPVFAEAYFLIGQEKILETLYFHYYDQDRYYDNLLQTGALEGEIEFIRQNLQTFMNEDKTYVNKSRIKLLISSNPELYFRNGIKQSPSLIFSIESATYSNLSRQNTIKLITNPETINYSAISVWQSQIGNFSSIETNSKVKISADKKFAVFYIKKSDIVGGTELLVLNSK